MKETTPKKEPHSYKRAHSQEGGQGQKKKPAPKKEMAAPAKAKMESAPLPAAVPTAEALLKKEDDKEGPDYKKGTQEGGVRGHCSASGGDARR
jgi:hypothetical protein